MSPPLLQFRLLSLPRLKFPLLLLRPPPLRLLSLRLLKHLRLSLPLLPLRLLLLPPLKLPLLPLQREQLR
jgi:hypothetical protein